MILDLNTLIDNATALKDLAWSKGSAEQSAAEGRIAGTANAASFLDARMTVDEFMEIVMAVDESSNSAYRNAYMTAIKSVLA